MQIQFLTNLSERQHVWVVKNDQGWLEVKIGSPEFDQKMQSAVPGVPCVNLSPKQWHELLKLKDTIKTALYKKGQHFQAILGTENKFFLHLEAGIWDVRNFLLLSLSKATEKGPYHIKNASAWITPYEFTAVLASADKINEALDDATKAAFAPPDDLHEYHFVPE